MSSNRLPGKVLLPVGGWPLAILCALRLSRDLHEIVVATSEDPSDDILAEKLNEAGISVFRGSLCNVLQRFVDASSDLRDDDVVVRATSDNPVPDAGFIQLMLSHYNQRSSCNYLGIGAGAGLPYGLSAEVVRVDALRAAASAETSSFDREHVTPWIRKNLACDFLGGEVFGIKEDIGNLTCTVDTEEDYQRAADLFDSIDCDARAIGWHSLVIELAKIYETTATLDPVD